MLSDIFLFSAFPGRTAACDAGGDGERTAGGLFGDPGQYGPDGERSGLYLEDGSQKIVSGRNDD